MTAPWIGVRSLDSRVREDGEMGYHAMRFEDPVSGVER